MHDSFRSNAAFSNRKSASNRYLSALFLSMALLSVSAYSQDRAVAPGANIVTVFKSPACGCCGAWIDHIKRAGFKVDVRDKSSEKLALSRRELGVPEALASCHTGVVGGYLIEGHVPAADIKRLLAQKLPAKGLAVAGMPIGSPGMESGEQKQSYAVILFSADGSQQVYAQHP